MDKINTFLIDNFGIIGIAVIILSAVVTTLAGYIYKLHKESRNDYKQDKQNWHDERKEFRESLDKNSDAILKVSEALNRNSNLVEATKILLETIVRER